MTKSKTAPRPRSRALPALRVGTLPGERFRARVVAGTSVVPCVIGPAGIVRRKREGDGATPAGRFPLRMLMTRADRHPPPRCALPRRRLGPQHGWCDDPRHPSYNRPVSLPFRAGHERLWREDGLYDLVVVVEHNMRPALRGRGSAIFIHVRSPENRPTAGCVALAPHDLRRLLTRIGPQTRLVIG